MELNASEAGPLYAQVAARIREQWLSGRYREGDRIPPVRELALALRINPNTVARAYRLLQQEGILESRPGGGNFIAEVPAAARTEERTRRLDELLGEFLRATDALHIPRNEVATALQRQIHKEAEHE